MVIRTGWLSETDILFQNSIRYSHHKENYLKSLQEGNPPNRGLSNEIGWSPSTTEVNLVQFLNVESGKVIEKLEKNNDGHLKKYYREKPLQIQKKQWKLTRELDKDVTRNG